MKRKIVLLSEHLANEAVEWLEESCELVVHAYDAPGFEQRLASADALIVRTYTVVDTGLLAAAPRLRVVGRAGAGLDGIDVAACRARGVEVVYTPGANTQAVVEYVLLLMGDATRPRPVLRHALAAQAWRQQRAQTVAQRQLDELELGVLGLGRIGQAVARAARALGMRVRFSDIVEIDNAQRHGAEEVPVERLFQQSDVISIHVDGRSENRHYVGGQLLQAMKADAVLINTSRGLVVDNDALATFLRLHPDAQAIIDVHDPEPFAADYPLLNLPNAQLHPHLASRTETAMRNMSWVVRDVVGVLEGRQPEHPAP